MKKKEYVLGSECPEMEEWLEQVEAYYRNYDASNAEISLGDQVCEFRDRMQGASQGINGLKRLFFTAQRAAGIASCALGELERIRTEHPDVVVRRNFGARCNDPRGVVSDASVLLSEFTPGVQERIHAAIMHGNQIFALSQLDEPMSDAYVGDGER